MPINKILVNDFYHKIKELLSVRVSQIQHYWIQYNDNIIEKI